jgi:dienelactone hydrolase
MPRYYLSLVFLLGAGLALADKPTDWPALIQKPHQKLPLPDLGLRPLLIAPAGQQITTRAGWMRERQRLQAAWQERMGKPPQKPATLDVQIDKTEHLAGYTRKLLRFHTADGDDMLAYLLVPANLTAGEKRPAVVVFHQTTKHTLNEPVGLGDNPELALAEQLVQRGFVVLAPQCFIMKGKGPAAQAKELAKKWPGWTGLGKMTFDASRCIDFLQSLPFVDGARIGCIGHSLGAKEVLFAMAFEPRFTVGVFNEGGLGLRMSNWTDPWYLTDRMKAHIPALENHQILALIAPRPILILGGDSADGDASWPFIHAALPVYQLLGAGDRIGLINHHGKHSFPREARETSYQWLEHWLK